MKKRRELDALVNGKSSRHRKKHKGQHELLRSATDSSEVEEFAIPPQTVVRKRAGLARLCSTCIAACGFFLVTACVVAVAGLVWVHVELKREVDNLTMELEKVKTDRVSSSDDFEDIQAWKTQLQNQLDQIQSALTPAQTDLEDLKTKVTQLTSSTKNLESRVAAAHQLTSLPDEFNALQETFAKFGSDLSSVKQDMSTAAQTQHDVEAELQTIQEDIQSLNTLSTSVPAMNKSLNHQLVFLQTHSEQHMAELESVVNSTHSLAHRVDILELNPSAGDADPASMQTIIEQAVAEAMSGVTAPTESASFSSINNRLNNITSQVENLSAQVESSISSPEDIKNINSQYTELSNQISTFNGSLSRIDSRITTLEETVQYIDSRIPTEGLDDTPPPASHENDLSNENEASQHTSTSPPGT